MVDGKVVEGVGVGGDGEMEIRGTTWEDWEGEGLQLLKVE